MKADKIHEIVEQEREDKMKFNIILSGLFLLIIAGCYTIYQHPNVVYKGEDGRVDLIEVNYKNNCASCHSESELEKYNYYVNKDVYLQEVKDTTSIVKYNDISYYYQMPWWYEGAFSDVYTPVRINTGIDGNYYSEPVREPSGYMPPIIFTTPKTSGNSNNSSSGSSTQTKTRNTSDNKKTESKGDQQKNSNTRDNDGSRKDGSGRKR